MVYIKEKHTYLFGCDRRDLQVWPLSHSLQNDCLPSSCLPGFIHTNCAVADPLSAKKKKKRQDRTWHDKISLSVLRFSSHMKGTIRPFLCHRNLCVNVCDWLIILIILYNVYICGCQSVWQLPFNILLSIDNYTSLFCIRMWNFTHGLRMSRHSD